MSTHEKTRRKEVECRKEKIGRKKTEKERRRQKKEGYRISENTGGNDLENRKNLKKAICRYTVKYITMMA